MEEVAPNVSTKKSPGLFQLLIILILSLILCVGIYFLLFRKADDIIRSGDPIITQLKEMKRYETSAYTIEQIIDAGKEGNTFQDILFGDKILLIAHGEVIAGFDMSTLTEESISVSDKTVTVTLPAPKILLTRLDNEKTRVYDRKQGLLTQGNKDLESEARRSAETAITKAACDGGILESASTNAKNQLTALIKAFGFTEVTIIIPRGSC